ncbi:hypothetical protein ACR3S4_26240 [Streptomyces sp. CH8.1]|uniref:hypothetical protein n=1 Tax=Streptomyces sp. CH8.1 TaxID=3439546 RepID=UPI003D9FE85E
MDDFLRLSASTARFTYGAPRALSFGDDGRLLWFLRSTGGTDAFDSLWVLDTATGEEIRLADPRELCPEPGPLPTAERRLRERTRLVAAGIGSYALSGDGRRAAFALYGRLYEVTADGAGATPGEIPAAGPALDPRPNADGSRTAYVADDALYVAPGGRVSPDDGAASRAERGARTATWVGPGAHGAARWWGRRPARATAGDQLYVFPAEGGEQGQVGVLARGGGAGQSVGAAAATLSVATGSRPKTRSAKARTDSSSLARSVAGWPLVITTAVRGCSGPVRARRSPSSPTPRVNAVSAVRAVAVISTVSSTATASGQRPRSRRTTKPSTC